MTDSMTARWQAALDRARTRGGSVNDNRTLVYVSPAFPAGRVLAYHPGGREQATRAVLASGWRVVDPADYPDAVADDAAWPDGRAGMDLHEYSTRWLDGSTLAVLRDGAEVGRVRAAYEPGGHTALFIGDERCPDTWTTRDAALAVARRHARAAEYDERARAAARLALADELAPAMDARGRADLGDLLREVGDRARAGLDEG